MERIVQIQTIDHCNAKCYKCPHKDVYHTNKQMTDEVFLKILYDIKSIIGDASIKFCLYLENEPLADKKLFKRAELIKSFFKNSTLEISTNCLLLPKYKEEVYEHFDIIVLSVQGNDYKTYNAIHRLNISNDYFQEIWSSAWELRERSLKQKKHVDVKYMTNEIKDSELKNVDEWYRMAYSRGGFLNKNKIIIKELEGCARNKHKFLNFLADGSIILCCMDYLRSTVLGNIKYQSLKEILESNLYNTMIQKVEGMIESEEDFICKKCELARSKRV